MSACLAVRAAGSLFALTPGSVPWGQDLQLRGSFCKGGPGGALASGGLAVGYGPEGEHRVLTAPTYLSSPTGCANRNLIMENSVYYVASPEACAAILWKSRDKAGIVRLLHVLCVLPPLLLLLLLPLLLPPPPSCGRAVTRPLTRQPQPQPQPTQATTALKITADDLLKFKVMDEKIPEPLGGAHTDPMSAFPHIKEAIMRNYRRCADYGSCSASPTAVHIVRMRVRPALLLLRPACTASVPQLRGHDRGTDPAGPLQEIQGAGPVGGVPGVGRPQQGGARGAGQGWVPRGGRGRR